MHFLRFIFSILIILIVIFLASLLLPSKVTVSKSVLINASQAKVDKEIQDFNNWKNWYPAFQNEKMTVINNPAKPGFINSVSVTDTTGKISYFDLMPSGKDTINIMATQSSTEINYQFFLTPHMDGQTQVTWNINVLLGWYPWEKAKGIFLDKISGPQYEAALLNLKRAVEK
jgi:hypothetical protein